MERDQVRRAGEEDAGDGRWPRLTHPVCTGDLVRGLSGLGNQADWPAIAGLLGFELRAAKRHTVESRPKPPAAVGSEISAPSGEVGRGAVEQRRDEPAASGGAEAAIPCEVERSTARHDPIPQVDPLPPGPAARKPVLKSLLDPLWERAILIELAGTYRAEGPFAVLDAVRLIARGEPMTKLPREAVLSVSRGCQILVDQGIAMRPFAEDTRQLVGSLRTAVGNAHTRVLSFVDSPQRGVLTEEYEDERYAPPDNGALVLAVSDLCGGGPRGAAREGDPREWLMLANAIHDAGSSLVVLNPYPPGRWPAALLGRIPIVHWDRATDVAGVRRTRRRSRR